MTTELTLKLDDIDFNVLSEMVYEENRLSTFLKNRQWPFLEDCNCTPEKMATAGFYWCGSESQPDLVRCFVCLKDFEGWEPNDIPKDEHKRLSPQCPYVKLGKEPENCTVKEVMELCQKSLINFIGKVSNTQVEQYTNLAKEISNKLEFLGESNMDVSD
ncbi:baculoviral IAP repeat-containing protein 5-like [Daphnia pulicaria]|uniref:baculoviral IAP repeat-containing protein 5-like n=1 Tax=Daphnia pulicaria TaxID=35523 RepID=UPI001EEC8C1E|nr:baculoviral IAP repeat-containing protein 5-like [Daphnia pulicaria]